MSETISKLGGLDGAQPATEKSASACTRGYHLFPEPHGEGVRCSGGCGTTMGEWYRSTISPQPAPEAPPRDRSAMTRAEYERPHLFGEQPEAPQDGAPEPGEDQPAFTASLRDASRGVARLMETRRKDGAPEPVAHLDIPDERAQAWFEVWDLCAELGMIPQEKRGIDCVTSFIRDLAAPPSPDAHAVRELVEALAKLEGACERVAAGRSQETYLTMLKAGQDDALLALDEARREARDLVRARTASLTRGGDHG